MAFLFALTAALIAYGSLYPFALRPEAVDAAAWRAFLDTWNGHTGRGDLLANIALFAPYGYLGMLAMAPRGSAAPRRRAAFVAVLVSGVALGVGLQVAQLYLSARVPALQDAVWNGVGLLAGAVPGFLPGLHPPEGRSADRWRSVPILLVAAWVAYRLMPFVPSLDVQNAKNSLKPLLLSPIRLGLQSILHDVAAWVTVACIWWRAAPRRRYGEHWLFVAVPAIFFVEVLIVDNAVSASNVAGAALALLVWFAVLRHVPGRTGVVALLLAAYIVQAGLFPFQFLDSPRAFHWVPFHGFLGGSMFRNTLSLLEKVFFYGSLVWLAREAGLGARLAAVLVALLVGAVEAAQVWFTGHTPEITDPLLVILIAWTLTAIESGRSVPVAEPPPHAPPPSA